MNTSFAEFNCPALMSDGRFITNYFPNQVFNETIRNLNKINSSHEYRMFLQKNGQSMMEKETKNLIERNSCKASNKCGKGRTTTKCGCE